MGEPGIRCLHRRAVTDSAHDQVARTVLVGTSFLKYKGECLKLLESEGWLEAVDPPPKRRKGTFADQTQLFRFVARS